MTGAGFSGGFPEFAGFRAADADFGCNISLFSGGHYLLAASTATRPRPRLRAISLCVATAAPVPTAAACASTSAGVWPVRVGWFTSSGTDSALITARDVGSGDVNAFGVQPVSTRSRLPDNGTG
jgi:hypothetical protein